MANAGDALAPGTRLGQFTIERVLGAGGFGVTYLARDESLGVWRALKEYLPRDWGTRRPDGRIGPRTEAEAGDYQWGLDRFLQEARILAQFDDRRIVRVYQVFEADGTAYMVTEYVEGRTLMKEVAATGLLPEPRARSLLAALADGLSMVHDKGLLHRDIKPENVMIRRDGTPVLIDFGSARQAMGRQSRSVTAVLTPGYAPLEQYSARGKQGPWTDIYSLGAVAYWALSGRVPAEAVDRVESDEVRPLAAVAAEPVSGALASAVDAALAVHRGNRPQSLADWRALLDRRSEGPEPSPDHSGSAVGGSAAGETGGGTAAADHARVVPPPGGRWWLVAAALGFAAASLLFALYLLGTRNASDAGGEASDGMPGVGAPALGADGAGRRVPPAEQGTTAVGAVADTEVDPPPVPPADPPAVADSSSSPEELEAGLGLDRAARRAVQEWLADAGFDPGTPDGVFGPGTRSRIRTWQTRQRLAATGYLDADQLALLRAAAEDAGRSAAALDPDPPAAPAMDPPSVPPADHADPEPDPVPVAAAPVGPFEVDASWPSIPNGWVLGQVSSVAVDLDDVVWVLHRPRTVSDDRSTAAPPVLAFEQDGTFVLAWGGPSSEGYDWPANEHGIHVDLFDNVWITGSGTRPESDDMLLKFTRTGEYLLQIGGPGRGTGNHDVENPMRPAQSFVYLANNWYELYVADGYGNRRVTVHDSATGEMKRYWGAFGNVPSDSPGTPGAPVGPEGPPQFGIVHDVKVSNDGLVYIADRDNSRVQVFTPAGEYVMQGFVNRGDESVSTVAGLAFSSDAAQRFLYVADQGNSHIHVLERVTLEVLDSFGNNGVAPGQFQGLHYLATDSDGNLYTAEERGRRLQKLLYTGVEPAP